MIEIKRNVFLFILALAWVHVQIVRSEDEGDDVIAARDAISFSRSHTFTKHRSGFLQHGFE